MKPPRDPREAQQKVDIGHGPWRLRGSTFNMALLADMALPKCWGLGCYTADCRGLVVSKGPVRSLPRLRSSFLAQLAQATCAYGDFFSVRRLIEWVCCSAGKGARADIPCSEGFWFHPLSAAPIGWLYGYFLFSVLLHILTQGHRTASLE